MAILAQIRNRPIFLILIIGMALFAFVLSGVFGGSNGVTRTSIGSVNGDEISAKAFTAQMEAQKSNSKSSLQTVKSVWDNIVKSKIYKNQIEASGIVVGENDIWTAIVAQNKNSAQFKGEDGVFDENKLKEFIATLNDNKTTPQGRQAWLSWVNNENNLKTSLEQQAYDNLIKAGLSASSKDGERTYVSENTSADIQFVYESYTSIKDEEVKVSDSEVTNYMNARSADYMVESSTAIDFVKFEVKPSTDDIATAKNKIKDLMVDKSVWNTTTKADEIRVGFTNAKDAKAFVNEYSYLPFVDKLYLSTDLPTAVYNNLSANPVGSVYGPYRDGEFFKVAKLISNTGLKSAKSSHILIAYVGATRAKPTVTRTREEAQAFVKTVKAKITSKNFADIAKEFSDGGSAPKGGDIGWFNEKSQLAEEYKDFIFGNKKGTIKIVETSFGFHIIKIEDTKLEAGLDLGILANKIEASTTTENQIFQDVEIFAANLKKGAKMIDAIKEKNYKMLSATNLTDFSESITSLGNQRSIVKWTFNKDTKVGDSRRFDLNDGGYAVVVLSKRIPKGLMPLNEAKLKVMPILVKQKKAALIKAKMKGATIDEVAKSVGKTVNSSKGLSISNPLLKIGGRDVNIAGAILYMKENDLKIIDGNSGVYAIKIDKKTTPYDIKNFTTYTNNITTKLKSRTSKVFDALKENSNIEDNKALFY